MRRNRIAVLMQTFEGLYHELVYEGLNDAAQECDIDLVFFPGTHVSDFRFAYSREAAVIYDLPDSDSIDGVIVLGTSMFANSFDGVRDRFLSRFTSFPLVLIGEPTDICPYIGIDPAPGIDSAVAHLADVHGYSRFGIITGPAEGWESRNRTDLFIQALERRHLAVDPGCMEEGLFTEDSGILAVEKLEEKGALDVDAIFVENDEMAIGVVNRLHDIGYSVPGDIAVIGFDGIPFMDTLAPPMTTVEQPVRHQANIAVTMMAELLRGEEPDSRMLSTRLRIRESCGCDETGIGSSEMRSDGLAIKDGTTDDIIGYISTISDREDLEDIRRDMLQRLNGSGRIPETGVESGRILDAVNRRLLNLQGQRLWKLMSFQWREWIASRGGLINSVDIEDVVEQMDAVCQHMKLGRIRIVIAPDRNDVKQGRIVYSYPDPAPTEGRSISGLAEVLPGRGGSDACFLVNPLYHRKNFYGYLVIEVKEHHITYYESIRNEISNAIHTIRLMRNLESTQKELARVERQSVIGSIISGVAHEINGPVGTALTAVTHIGYLAESGDLDGIINAAETAARSLKSAGALVADLKNLHSDSRGYADEAFAPKEWIESTLESFPEVRESSCRCSILGSDLSVMNGSPHDLRRIILELADNALNHGRTGSDPIGIYITVTLEDDQLTIDFHDDGAGVDDEALPKLFEPFYTTGRSRGHKGLGLAGLYEMVVTRHQGRMTARRSANGGLGFTIELPWKPA